MEKHRIYCSGPLFCAEEIGGMSAIAITLEEAGFQTFLPHRDGLEGYVMRFENVSMPSMLSGLRTRIDYAIYALDVYELLERCSAVVCNLNGRVPDEGMIVEAALAHAAGKPLLLFKDDARAPFGGYDNSMLTSLAQGKITRKLNDIPAALQQAMSEKSPSGKSELITLASDLKKAVAYGKRLASVMARLPEKAGKKQWSEAVINEVITEALKET